MCNREVLRFLTFGCECTASSGVESARHFLSLLPLVPPYLSFRFRSFAFFGLGLVTPVNQVRKQTILLWAHGQEARVVSAASERLVIHRTPSAHVGMVSSFITRRNVSTV